MAEISGRGIPTNETAAAIGDIYTDTDTGQKYKCDLAYASKDEKGNDFTYYLWIKLKNESSGSGGTLDPYIDNIKKNTEYIGNLKEDLSNKITKFYASNHGETHITDSDNGKIMDMMLYGKSERFTTTGKNLLKIIDRAQTTRGITVTGKDGVFSLKGTATETGWAVFDVDSFVLDGTCIVSSNMSTTIKVVVVDKAFKTVLEDNKPATLENAEVSKVCFTVTEGKTYDISNILVQIEKGSKATSYEPYTGGIPSPSPYYPQEIKSVVNPVIKVCEANILNIKNINETVNNNNGLTYSVKNGVIKVKGTATSNVGIGLTLETASGSLELKKNNTYIFNPNSKKVEDNNVYLDLTNSRSLGISLKSNNINKPIKPTEKDVKHLFSLAVRVKQGVTIDMEWKPQLLLNESLLPYKPYTEQSVILPVTLNAIPVSSGGNVTIDGQQYIADYVDVERGKLVRMVDTLHPKLAGDMSAYAGVKEHVTNYRTSAEGADKKNILSNMLLQSSLVWSKDVCGVNVVEYDKVDFSLPYETLGINSSANARQREIAVKAWLENNDLMFMYIRRTSNEIDLAPEEVQAFKALATYYPVTNISVNSGQLDGYTVFNYPISMQNGWNYVKKQLGDTRDYIYDMDAKAQDIDIQSAEAYVNSEYAVALTELEV